VAYGYDAANRLTTVTDWAGRVTAYGYDSDSHVISIQRPDRTTETFTYDAAGQVTGSVDVSSTNIQVLGYSYDAVGKITTETMLPEPAPFTPSALSLGVDADNRLTNINGQPVGYDLNGNMTNALIPGSAITSLTYDARNRLTSAGGLTYGYDQENRRTSVTAASGKTTFVINPNAALDQVLVKTAPDGTVTRYVYGLGLIGEETDGNFTTYHYDHRGSTTALTDIHGTVIQRFSYGPRGEPVGFNPAIAPIQFLYNGRYGIMTDANGLEFMRARYYSPSIVRFINQDVLLGKISPGMSMNRFAYANGDPINRNDPLGLCATAIKKYLPDDDFIPVSPDEYLKKLKIQEFEYDHFRKDINKKKIPETPSSDITSSEFNSILETRANDIYDKGWIGGLYYIYETSKAGGIDDLGGLRHRYYNYGRVRMNAWQTGNLLVGYKTKIYDDYWLSGLPVAQIAGKIFGIFYHVTGNTEAKESTVGKFQDQTGMPDINNGIGIANQRPLNVNYFKYCSP
jgi:RHS repeat-associated protein